MSKLGNITTKAKSSINTSKKQKLNTMTRSKSLKKSCIYNPYVFPYNQNFLYYSPFLFQNPCMTPIIPPSKPKKSKSKSKATHSSVLSSKNTSNKKGSISSNSTKTTSTASTTTTTSSTPSTITSTTNVIATKTTTSTTTTLPSTTSPVKSSSPINNYSSKSHSLSATTTSIPSISTSSTNSYGLDQQQQLGCRIKGHTEKGEGIILNKLTSSPKPSSIYEKEPSTFTPATSSPSGTYTNNSSSSSYSSKTNSKDNYINNDSHYPSSHTKSNSTFSYPMTNTSESSYPTSSFSDKSASYPLNHGNPTIKPSSVTQTISYSHKETTDHFDVPSSITSSEYNMVNDTTSGNPKHLPTPPTTPLTKWSPNSKNDHSSYSFNPSCSKNMASTSYDSTEKKTGLLDYSHSHQNSSTTSFSDTSYSHSQQTSSNTIPDTSYSHSHQTSSNTIPDTSYSHSHQTSSNTIPDTSYSHSHQTSSNTIPNAKSYVNKYISTSFDMNSLDTNTKIKKENSNYNFSYDSRKRKYEDSSSMMPRTIENSIMEKSPKIDFISSNCRHLSDNNKIESESSSSSYPFFNDSYNTSPQHMDSLTKDEKNPNFKSYSNNSTFTNSLNTSNTMVDTSSPQKTVSSSYESQNLMSSKTKVKTTKYKRPKTYTTNIQLLSEGANMEWLKEQEKKLYAKHASRMNANLMNSLSKTGSSSNTKSTFVVKTSSPPPSYNTSVKSSSPSLNNNTTNMKVSSPTSSYDSTTKVKSPSPSYDTTSMKLSSSPALSYDDKTIGKTTKPTILSSYSTFKTPSTFEPSYSLNNSLIKKEYPSNYSSSMSSQNTSQVFPSPTSTASTFVHSSYQTKPSSIPPVSMTTSMPTSTTTSTTNYSSSYYSSSMNDGSVHHYNHSNSIPSERSIHSTYQNNNNNMITSDVISPNMNSQSTSSYHSMAMPAVVSTPSSYTPSQMSCTTQNQNTYHNRSMTRETSSYHHYSSAPSQTPIPMVFGEPRKEENGMDMHDAAEILLQMHLCV